jgi:hypothetical protein
MDSIFRIGQSRKDFSFIKKGFSNVAQNIANGYWDRTINPSRKFSVTLKLSDGALLSSTPVRYAVFEYKDGIPYNKDWLVKNQSGVQSTDSSGNLEILYTGSSNVGAKSYIAVFYPVNSPTQSLIWEGLIS